MNNNINNNKKMNNEVELNNNKGEIKMNKKELKKINNKETCGAFCVNREFGKEFRQLTGECATLTKVEKIKKIIDQEINNDVITTKDELLQRRYELTHELYILGEEVEPREKELKTTNIINNHCSQCGAEIEGGSYCPECGAKIDNNEKKEPLKTKYQIELPYTCSGVMIGYGKGAFSGFGGMAGRIGEGTTNWRFHKCYVKENGLSIEETGDFIRFDKIESINTGEKEGIFIKHINVSLELKNKESFSFRIHPSDLSLLEIIEDNMMFEDNIISENNTVVSNNDSALDELLKAKELLDAGLLTEEEFYELKYKILDNI